MNNLKRNSTLLKHIMLILIGIIFTIISIIKIKESYSYYSDDWGTDISFDTDYIVLLVCSIIILIYGIYSLAAYKKNLKFKNAYYMAFGTISCLIAFYPLGIFFKSLAKDIPFNECADYLYIGIIGIVMLLYVGFSYLSNKNE